MQTVREIAREIVAREGGYVNDPDDPGGATNYGVTIHTMRRLGLDLTGDGVVGVADVRALTRAQAEEIFVDHYFHRPRIAALPQVLQASVFDMYVNAGANAVKILQRLLRQMGQEVSVDGAIGPQTIAATQAAHDAAPDHCHPRRRRHLAIHPCTDPSIGLGNATDVSMSTHLIHT